MLGVVIRTAGKKSFRGAPVREPLEMRLVSMYGASSPARVYKQNSNTHLLKFEYQVL